MATVNNSQTLIELREAAQLQQGREATPNILGDRVIPVMEVNPKLLRRAEIIVGGGATASSTLLTLASDKDFYLTSATLSRVKDAASTLGTTTLTVVPWLTSTTTDILAIAGITLTADPGQTVAISYPVPLRLKRGSIIRLTNDASGAVNKIHGCITGYYVENSGG